MATPTNTTPSAPQHPKSAPQPSPAVLKPLTISEAMRRMRDMLLANKLSTETAVTFSHKHTTFTAKILSDGSLKAPLPNTNVYKLYSSPSEFASDMLARSTEDKRRGKISVNGWDECLVNGRTLASVRTEMLRQRKADAAHPHRDRVAIPVQSKVFHAAVVKEKPLEKKTRSPPKPLEKKPMSPPRPTLTSTPAPTPIQTQTPTPTPPTPPPPPPPPPPKPTPKRPSPVIESKPVIEKPSSHIGKDVCTPNRTDEPASGNNAPPPTKTVSLGQAEHPMEIEPKPKKIDESPRKIEKLPEPSTETPVKVPEKPKEDSPVRKESPVVVKPVSEKPKEKKEEKQPADAKDTVTVTPVVEKDVEMKDIAPEENTPDVIPEKEQVRKFVPTPVDATLVEAASVEAASVEAASVEAASVDVTPVDVTPVDATPVDATLVDATPVDATPVDATPVDTTPADTTPVDTTPIGSAPVAPNVDVELVASTQPTVEEITKKPEDVPPAVKPTQKTHAEQLPAEKAPKTEQIQVETDEKKTEEEIKPKQSDRTTPEPMKELKNDDSVEPVQKVEDLKEEILGDSDSESYHNTMGDAMGRTSKKRYRSPAANESRKRKRTSRNVSPSTDKPLLQKVEDGKNFKPTDIASVHGMDASQLDPEAMQIAALSAQMDREEANTRGRRTTRLAAGKIKQVDYKASANALSSRTISPGRESPDMDGNSGSVDSPGQGTRSSRRRAAQGQAQPAQRQFRRTTRLRNAQDRVQSPSDEGDRNEGGRYIDEPFEYGTREGKPYYKRSRSQSGGPSKRARHGYAADGDNETTAKPYGTRAATRENSFVDGGDTTDLGDPNGHIDLDEDLDEDERIEDRIDANGFNISDLVCIGQAVKTADSLRSSDIVELVVEQDDWTDEDGKEDKVKSYISNIVNSIKELGASLGGSENKEYEVTVDQVLSFIAIDINRLRTASLPTGFPRKPTAILRQASNEDQQRASLERNKKKESREVDDLRGTLEKDMETRRKTDLDILSLEVLLFESQRAVERESKRAKRLDEEIEKYAGLESEAENWLERTKRLIGQLRGGGENREENTEGVKEQEQVSNAKPRNRGNAGGEKDEDTADRKKSSREVVQTSNKNVTTTSQRLLQMDRFRVLIAAKETEAQEYQRTCERHRMRFVQAQEVKQKLEVEIFNNKTAHAAGMTGPGSTPTKSRKDSSKKGDHRGPGGTRNGNGGRGKGHASKGPGGLGVSTPSRGLSKPKTGTARAGDNGKGHKRKSSKANGSTSEKN